jgi:hypothetical protein
MDYQTLSPSACAAELLDKILGTCGTDVALRDKLEPLLRQKIRMIFEHCAEVAEQCGADLVATSGGLDLTACDVTTMEVADHIAEQIRKHAEERRSLRGVGETLSFTN